MANNKIDCATLEPYINHSTATTAAFAVGGTMKHSIRTLAILVLIGTALAFGQTPGTSQYPASLDTDTTLLVAANGCSTTLNGAINNSVTSITVNSQTCFPATGVFAISSEYFIYTASTSTTFTVTRGAFGSTAISHANGTPVRLSIVAAYHNVHKDAIKATQAKIGTGANAPTNNTVFRGTGAGTSDWGQITNSHVDNSAAIAYSKLNLATSISSGDLATSVITGLTAETTADNADLILIYDDSAGALRKMTRANFTAGGGGSGTVNTGAANALAFYPSAGTTVDDAVGATYDGSTSPNLKITSQNSTHVPLEIRLASGQSAGALEVKNNGGAIVSSLTSSGGYSVTGDSSISLTSSSTSFPRKLQLTNVGSGTAFRWEFESEGTGIANREGGKLQLFARYGVKIVGTRNSSFAPSFETGASTDPALHVENGATGVIPLVANAISSTTVSTFEAQTNGTRVFAVKGAQFYGSHHSQGNVSGAVTIDFANGNMVSVTVTGNITSMTFSNLQAGGSYKLRFTQDGTGGRTWTPSSSNFLYPGGVGGSILSPGANAVDVFHCDSFDGSKLVCNGLFDVQ